MVKDQSHLSNLSSWCLGRSPGGGVRTVSECWTWTLNTPESVPKLGTSATQPASSSKYSLPPHSCPFLNNKQSRIVSGACCTSAVLHCPSLMKPTAYCSLKPEVWDCQPVLSLPPCCRFQRFTLRCIFCCFCLQGFIFIWWIWLCCSWLAGVLHWKRWVGSLEDDRLDTLCN